MNLERVQLALVAAVAATCLVSIWAAQAFLFLALLVFLGRLLLRQTRLDRIPLDGPLLAFIVWTLLSASFSPDPGESFRTGGKKLVLFVLLYLAVDSLLDERNRERILDAAILGGLVLGAGALIQYYFLDFNTVNRRPTSFLGHWMTASGLCMSVLVLAVARLAFRRGPLSLPERSDWLHLTALAGALATLALLKAIDVFAVDGERLFVAGLAVSAGFMATSRGGWPGPATSLSLTVLAVPVCAWALLFSGTRSAWLGAVAGLAVIVILRAPRALWLIPAGVGAILILRPQPVINRLTVTDLSSRDRIYLWQAGVDMILDKPVFGQGPGIIPAAYEKYRWPGAPSGTKSHLHNNALHLAAERGLPCLAWWLWWVSATMADAFREARRGTWDAAWGAAGVVGFLTAILVAGMFEYNFGDSEILYLILLVSALPYAVRRRSEPAAA